MKKTIFILWLVSAILVIVLPIEPKPLGWILSLICGWFTGISFAKWKGEEK